MDGFDGDFECADVVGGNLVNADAEEEVGCEDIDCGGLASGGDGDVLVEDDSIGHDVLEVVGGGLDVRRGGDGVGYGAVVGVNDGDEAEVVAVGSVGEARELEVLRVDPIVDAVVAIGQIAKRSGDEVALFRNSADLWLLSFGGG